MSTVLGGIKEIECAGGAGRCDYFGYIAAKDIAKPFGDEVAVAELLR